ncbi:unnamed protein product [Didymodactylos carnosus]|uniref:Uncharacterized protein n=1 Tax=Didymodactylos carnosus TaxID=1234261 RepID=A0A8S2K984_9BILA|nr:unnamed protein product [Didymodactylos carnosus]CAF3843832.1 unnamed protein product [Didymodactylos carnosus]
MMPYQLSVGNEVRESLVGKPTRKYLKKFSLNGFITTFRQFQILLTQFSSTLEYLSLHIHCDTDLEFINGHDLYHQILSKLSKLKYLHFCIQFYHYYHQLFDKSSVDDDKMKLLPTIIDLQKIIKTYQTPYWLQQQTIFFYEHEEKEFYVCATLPYHYQYFRSLTSNMVNYHLNKALIETSSLLTMSKVNKIEFYDDEDCPDDLPLTLELFQFIQKTLSRVNILILHEYYNVDRNVTQDKVQLPTVEELQYDTYYLDYNITKLLPNLQRKICRWVPYIR